MFLCLCFVYIFLCCEILKKSLKNDENNLDDKREERVEGEGELETKNGEIVQILKKKMVGI